MAVSALGLVALPDCSFTAPASGPGPNLKQGSTPRTSAIFCDIEVPLGRHCASDDEIAIGVRLSEAAVALTRRDSSTIGIDDSPAALGRCGGRPEAVTFRCPFPEGCPVCLNCLDAIGPAQPHANPDAACVAKCEDFFGTTTGNGVFIPDNPPDPSVVDFCTARARASTNVPTDDCFGGLCTPEGGTRPDFDTNDSPTVIDPRRVPEPVEWVDLVEATASGFFGNTLTRTTAGVDDFVAGAASSQLITQGDGFVEFTLAGLGQARLCGLSSGAGPDTDATPLDVDFAIRATEGNRLLVSERGVLVPGPLPDGTWGTYALDDRIRVSVIDRHDGTADVRYEKIPASCAGYGCAGTLIKTSGPAPYPFRVDASLRTVGATLGDVRLARIK
jgi:hypothetical protein